MLNTLRENLKRRSWPKWLLAVVAASMTLYLANAFFGAIGGSDESSGEWAAKLDGQTISAQQFMRKARLIDQNYRQLFGTNYGQMQSQIKVGSQAMRQLLEEAIILRDARRIGLSVSNAELVDYIRSAPELAGPDGTFIGKKKYEAIVSRGYPGGVPAFEAEMADTLLMQKWTDLISQPISVDESDVQALFRQRNEKTSVDYVVVRSSDQTIDTTVTDEQAEAWYSSHQDRYRRDEGRRISYVTIERPTQLGDIQIPEDELRAAYEANQAQYTHPEQRRARHILLRVPPGASEEDKEKVRKKAEDLLARIRGGEDFATLARKFSDDKFSGQRGGDLDWFGKGQMVPAFESAAFDTPPGQLAPLTETEYGFHIIEVTGARPAGTLPFEEVRDSILSELRTSRVEKELVDRAQSIRDRIDSAETLQSVATEEGLQVEQRFVNESEGMREIGASSDFREAVLKMEPGEISAPLRVSRGLAIVRVDEIVAPSVAPFAEIEDRVRSDVLNERSKEAALEAGRKALAGSKTLAAAAKKLDGEVKDSGELAPGQTLPGTGGPSTELQAALFGDETVVGGRGVAAVPAGAVVYEVTAHVAFDPDAFAQAREALRAELIQQRRDGMRRSMVDQISRESEIKINEPLVKRLDGGPESGA